MNRAKEAVCPYCCKKYSPSNMWFRLEHPLTSGEGDGLEQDYVDEKLKAYYMEFEHYDEIGAENAARIKAGGREAVCIDLANEASAVTDLDTRMLDEYGFVTELTYKGQHLTRRLCPHCHNEAVPGAGMYDMKMIGLYGDTFAGKTVFLTVLEALLKGDPRISEYSGSFHGGMAFRGSDEEKENHTRNYEQLIGNKTLFDATMKGMRVPPQSFLFKYKTADNAGRYKELLVVFCDIPGEDTGAVRGLRASGFYLKYVDGILALLDSTRLVNVAPFMKGEADAETNADASGGNAMRAVDAISTLSDYLASTSLGQKIPIPTAVVMTKLDMLKNISDVAADEGYRKFINVPDANSIHISFLNKKVIDNLNKAVKNLVGKLGGQLYCNTVDQCFANYKYFAVSALGKATEKETVSLMGGGETVVKRVKGNLEPFRVTEPFYWLLAQWSCIPYRYREVWMDKKGKKELVEFYYYAWEQNGTANRKLQEIRASKKIKEGKWRCIERDNAI